MSPTKGKEAAPEEAAAETKENVPEESGEPDMKDLVVKDDIDEPEEDPAKQTVTVIYQKTH